MALRRIGSDRNTFGIGGLIPPLAGRDGTAVAATDHVLRALPQRQNAVDHLAGLAEIIRRIAKLLQLGLAHVL
jgi:hypothetical protein